MQVWWWLIHTEPDVHCDHTLKIYTPDGSYLMGTFGTSCIPEQIGWFCGELEFYSHGRQGNLEEFKTGQKTGVQDRSIVFLTWREQRQFGDAAYVYACRLVHKCLSLWPAKIFVRRKRQGSWDADLSAELSWMVPAHFVARESLTRSRHELSQPSHLQMSRLEFGGM